jgi:flavin reductase (DIM6/NTAB) family NADH-FMN oxidoreductase RutF
VTVVLEYLYPIRTYLIVAGTIEKPNAMTADWVIPLSFEPSLVGISIEHTRYTNKLIKEQKNFVVAVPTLELLRDVWIAGTTSGAKTNKAEKMSVTFVRSEHVDAPSIKECQANIECRVVNEVEVGDHTLFVGEIVNVTCGDAFISGKPDLNYSYILHSSFGKGFTVNRQEEFKP